MTVAARLRISPGTLYNTVGDIDDIILLVNQETLMRLRDALWAPILAERDVMQNVFAVGAAYVDFVLERPKRWSMLFQYALLADREAPQWYLETLHETMAAVDQLLRPMIPDGGERKRAVAILWATLEGISSLSASGSWRSSAARGRTCSSTSCSRVSSPVSVRRRKSCRIPAAGTERRGEAARNRTGDSSPGEIRGILVAIAAKRPPTGAARRGGDRAAT